MKLQQDLSTLSDSCREVVEVEFYMFEISPFFNFMYAALSLILTGILRSCSGDCGGEQDVQMTSVRVLIP